MTRLVWNTTESKRYESGVDRGVFYPLNGPGVVWNGLVRIEESFSGGESTPYHFDGIKYIDVVSPKTYQATITAYSAPKAFFDTLGSLAVIPGFVLTRQARTRFNLSYRTLLGDNLGYKLHLVYNVLAKPNGRQYSTIEGSVSSEAITWKLDAVPPKGRTYRPSAHFTIDSTKIPADALQTIEDILYGRDGVDPRFPTYDELLDIVTTWAPVVLVLDSATGLNTLSAGVGDLYPTHISGVYAPLPRTRLSKMPTPNGLYRME